MFCGEWRHLIRLYDSAWQGRWYDAGMSSGVRDAPRKGPLFWVLSGGAIFLALLFGFVFAIAYLNRGTGAPYEMLRKSVISSSSVEILEESPETNSIRVRDKRTGKELIHSVDPVAKQFHVREAPSPNPETAGK